MQKITAKMSEKDAFKFIIIRSIGNFLVLFSLYGVFATFGPALYYELQFRIIEARGIQFSIRDPLRNSNLPNKIKSDRPSFGDVLSGEKQQVIIPQDTFFSIVIPKIGASAKIFPNIDPIDEKIFKPILYKGVAHAKGTVFPGMKGNIYLFAHSTDNFWNVGRYNAVFYLLKELSYGDQIVIFFENKRYNYIVNKTYITDADEVSAIVNSQNRNQERLILQTCWPPGTTWKRLFVEAVPAVEIN